MSAPGTGYGVVEDALLRRSYDFGRVMANVHLAMKALERGNPSQAYDDLLRAIEIGDGPTLNIGEAA